MLELIMPKILSKHIPLRELRRNAGFKTYESAVIAINSRIKSDCDIINIPQITMWELRGSPRLKYEHAVALSKAYKCKVSDIYDAVKQEPK